MTDTPTPISAKKTSSESPSNPKLIVKVGVLVATPVKHWGGPDSFHPRHKAFLQRLAELSVDPDCPFEFWQSVVEGGIAWGRNRMVGNFRKLRKKHPNLKWLYWADDDVEQTAEGLLRLLSHKHPIVGSLYTVRAPDGHWVATFMYEVKKQAGDLLQVLECGTGGLLTFYELYDVLEQVYPYLEYIDRDSGEKLHAFFQQVVIDKVPYPEDYFFCYLCRYAKLADEKVGVGIFVDTTMKLKHRGPDGTLYPTEWPPIPGIE